jgi:hypothetical protein
MKLRPTLRPLLASIAFVATSGLYVSCEKTPDKPTKPAGESTIPGTAAPTPAVEKPAASVPPAPAPVAVAPASELQGLYGFAARIPKDVEAFSSNYRMIELWQGLTNSKFAADVLALPVVKGNPDIQKFLAQWNDPKALQMRDLAAAILGNEFFLYEPSGFGDQFSVWMNLISEIQSIQYQSIFTRFGGGGNDPAAMIEALKANLPELLPIVGKVEIPPLVLGFKAGASKQQLNSMLDATLQGVLSDLPPGFETAAFQVDGKFEFKSLTVNVRKLVSAVQEAQLLLQAKEVMGDEKKAQELVTSLMAKRVEVAWGWVEDNFVLSIGTDHGHLKFAASPADSAISIPEVAKRASQFAGKKPFGLGYASAALFKKLETKIEFVPMIEQVTDAVRGILKPEAIDKIRSDAKALQGKFQAAMTVEYDSLVSVSWWDSGMHAEMFGGVRSNRLNSSKSLNLASLASPTTFLIADSRVNEAEADKVLALLEESATTIWGWYESYGRAMVPESERQQVAMAEVVAVPLIKQFWNSSRQLGKALGDESAFLIDLNGEFPKVPNAPIPPTVLAGGKVPRIAWVADLKNRAALADAWTGFSAIVKQIMTVASQGASTAPQVPEPVSKKVGNAELHYIPLPMDTGDLLPHVAITADRWMVSSSPTYSAELAGKGAAAGGTALGSHWTVNFPALWNLADVWLKVAESDPAAFFDKSESTVREFNENKPLIRDIIRLLRSVGPLDVQMTKDGALNHDSIYFQMQDVK